MPIESSAATHAPAWRKSWVRDYFESILIAVIFALFIRTFVAQAFKIPSRSMEDGLLVGDHIVVNKFVYAPHAPWMRSILPYREPAAGDVMVFKYPKVPAKDFIKRVIAVGGDTIAIERGQVIRNGERVEEPYVVYKDRGIPGAVSLHPARRYIQEHLRSHLIPPGELWVMGDNRLNSEDSRFWGTVPPGNVKGKALLIYWSFDVPERFEDVEQELAAEPGDRARLLAYTALHFFDKTRWSRTFRRVR